MGTQAITIYGEARQNQFRRQALTARLNRLEAQIEGLVARIKVAGEAEAVALENQVVDLAREALRHRRALEVDHRMTLVEVVAPRLAWAS